MIETEVKIRIKDIDSTVKRIIQQGARLEKERYLEENTLYDFSSQLLYKKKQALRLRKISKKTFLAFKGVPQKSRKFKIREEYEAEVKNEREFKKILKSVGLSPTFQYKKNRRVFRKKRLKICLDETPVGDFLELEGEREDIVKTAKALGFSKKEFIKSDYIQLIKEAKKKERTER